MPLTWPIDTLEPEKLNWGLSGGNVDGGSNLDGWSQTGSFGGGGFWILQMTRVLINEPEQHLAWRGIRSYLNQGAQAIVVAVPDYGAFEELYDGTPNIVTVGTAALRATLLRLNVIAGPVLQGGMVFSVLDDQGLPRRHEINFDGVTAVAGQPTQYDVRFRPPLRAAVGAGANAEFADPACVMKLAVIDSMDGDMEAARFGEIDPVLVEFFGVI